MQKIMFNDAMALTEATLCGRKTNTRRDELTEEQQGQLEGFERQGLKPVIIDNHIVVVDYIGVLVFKKKTRYKVGEIVAVAQSYKDVDSFYKEAFRSKNAIKGQMITGVGYDNVSDKDIRTWLNTRKSYEGTKSWTNKMFVCASRMPYHIRITDIRIERLQDISDDDCMKEGITYKEVSATKPYGIYTGKRMICLGETPRKAFAALIGKVSGKGTWERNPYVVVYDYELVK